MSSTFRERLDEIIGGLKVDQSLVGDYVGASKIQDSAPATSVRYDKGLNKIEIISGSTYYDRDSAFTLMDEIAKALEVQAKLGGAG